MSEQDKVKPYHAKDTAPGKEAADVVAEVLKHAEEREKAAKSKVTPKGPPKWMLPVSINLGLLALFFLIAQPEFLVVSPVEDPRTTQETIDSNRNAIYMMAITPIEDFRDTNGRLPATLEEAGSMAASLGAQGLDYSVQGNDYILLYEVDGVEITYDSATMQPEDFPTSGLARAVRG